MSPQSDPRTIVGNEIARALSEGDADNADVIAEGVLAALDALGWTVVPVSAGVSS